MKENKENEKEAEELECLFKEEERNEGENV